MENNFKPNQNIDPGILPIMASGLTQFSLTELCLTALQLIDSNEIHVTVFL